jgi:hypothetical protein
VLDYFRARREGDAYEIARLVAVAAWSVAPGFIDATTAWHVIWAAASLGKRTYGSWRELAETYAMIFVQITDNRASVDGEVARLLADPASPWVELPWDLNMGFAFQFGRPFNPVWHTSHDVAEKELLKLRLVEIEIEERRARELAVATSNSERALIKARVGDEVQLMTPGGLETLEVLAVSYPKPGA